MRSLVFIPVVAERFVAKGSSSASVRSPDLCEQPAMRVAKTFKREFGTLFNTMWPLVLRQPGYAALLH